MDTVTTHVTINGREHSRDALQSLAALLIQPPRPEDNESRLRLKERFRNGFRREVAHRQPTDARAPLSEQQLQQVAIDIVVRLLAANSPHPGEPEAPR